MDAALGAALAALLGLATTSSSLVGAGLGLYVALSKRLLACVLAFAAGSLIAALAIELAYEGAQQLRGQGFGTQPAWGFIGGGFALGATLYYAAALFLERRGAAVRYPTRFREYALERKQQETRQLIDLLACCGFLRQVPAEAIEQLLQSVQSRHLATGEILFRAGDPGDALYIVASGKVEVLPEAEPGQPAQRLAELGQGHAFGEMALLGGGRRTATVRALVDTELLAIAREDFARLMASEPAMARAMERLSHDRAIDNLSAGRPNPATWIRVAGESLDRVSRADTARLLAETGRGAGLAIVFGNILDTIPGCLVIGARFDGVESLSLTLMLGMFLGGIPEAAASAAMLRRAGFRPRAIFALWSAVLVAGLVAAAAGYLLIGNTQSLLAVLTQAVAGGAVLALVAHAMIPEAIDEGGSLIVLPTVAGFIAALYLALLQSAA
jgi:CRP-like cAMP-binding protein